jgi:hypothetical protein
VVTHSGIICDFENEFASRMTSISRSIVPANGQMGLLDEDREDLCGRLGVEGLSCILELLPGMDEDHRSIGREERTQRQTNCHFPMFDELANSDLIPTTPSTKWPSNRENVSASRFEREVDRVLGIALPFIANFTAGAIAGV